MGLVYTPVHPLIMGPGDGRIKEHPADRAEHRLIGQLFKQGLVELDLPAAGPRTVHSPSEIKLRMGDRILRPKNGPKPIRFNGLKRQSA